MKFVLCYEMLNEKGVYESTWEIVSGEDAMNTRIVELEEEFGIDFEYIMIFDLEDQL